MSSEADVKFEIGHVLFVDIVGYSRLLIHEQSEQLQKLREIARATEQFRVAQAEGKLLRLPTGDGGALVFRDNPEAPVGCALEISKALKNHPDLRVRMGIHSGPVKEVTDLNEQANIAGAGINMAQRVMDCGDAGHILLSKRVADDLEQYGRWRPLLHDLGICEVKHGATLGVVNLYSDEFGNPETPKKFKAEEAAEKKPSVPILRKSIALLPFENLSEDKANAYFADGIQEEILTRLSRIGDLKVISRTSTQRFKNSLESIPDIAKQLGVATTLEGSVRKAADQVRVHVQLIDAENDSHLWAERYDRKLIDIFAVESDIAAKIADALHAKLTGAERRAISSQPTKNTEAYQLYLKARHQWRNFFAPGYEQVRKYFQRAIELDPFFPGLHLFAGRILFFLRDYDGAIAYFTTTLELQPTNAVAHEHFGDACERKGMLHEAITQWCASLTLGGQPEQAQFLEQAFAASGFDAPVRALAQRQLQHLNERSACGEYVPAWNYLTAYVRLGDKEQALVWLAKTVEERNWFAFETRVTPILDPLRNDQRFHQILAVLPTK